MSVTLMTETNLYKDDAIADAVDDASKVATNYLAYNAQDGLTVGRTGQSERAVITSDGMEIYDGQNEKRAEFKAVTRLGEAGKANLQLDYHSMQLQDTQGKIYFHISDLRDQSGYAHYEYNYTGDGSTTDFEIAYDSSATVYVNGSVVSVSDYYTLTTGTTHTYIVFRTAPSNGSNIVIKCIESSYTLAYTLGKRKTSSVVGADSYALGIDVEASSIYSHAEGVRTASKAPYAHAEGFLSIASGDVSHAEGYYSKAKGWCSHAEGDNTIAAGVSQHVCGKYNVSTTSPMFIVGGGEPSFRKNAMTVLANGNTTIAGTLTQSSDKRLKLHYAYLSDQEQDVNSFIENLKPAYFEKDQAKHLGFYAQDVQLSDKWNTMVSEDTNGYLALGYTEIIAPLVAYVQNQQKKIDSLEERIARLEQLINQQ